MFRISSILFQRWYHKPQTFRGCCQQAKEDTEKVQFPQLSSCMFPKFFFLEIPPQNVEKRGPKKGPTQNHVELVH